jgi:hypothetical protein
MEHSLVGKNVAVGFRYVTEMGAAEGTVLEETPNGIFVQVKRKLMFYPWTSIVFVRIDE